MARLDLDHWQPPPPQGHRALSDALFGPGFLLPGGEQEALRLIRPLHLSNNARLLVAGRSIAGPANAIAAHLGIAVGGYDRSENPAGMQAIPFVQLVAWDPGRATLPTAAYHHALALHPLGDGPVEPVLSQIVDALRPAGQVILLDYVASAGFDPATRDARAWLAHENRTDPPPNAPDLARSLVRLGLHLRESEDLSHLHARLAVYDWRRLLGDINGAPAPPSAQTLLAEANGWALRARLLREGGLRLIRWHGVLPGQRPAADDLAPS
jgi:SAM-dependent methyltransferase